MVFSNLNKKRSQDISRHHRKHAISSKKNKNKNFHSHIVAKWSLKSKGFEVWLNDHKLHSSRFNLLNTSKPIFGPMLF